MTERSVQQAHEGLRVLEQKLEHMTQTNAGTGAIPLETILLQALMLSVDFVSAELQPTLRQVIDTVRLLRKNDGGYISFEDQLVGEQVISLYEDEAAAHRGLARIQRLEVAGRVQRMNVSISQLPTGHTRAHFEETTRWAVLVSSDVDRKALLARLYPRMASPNSLGATIASYDRAYQERG